MFAATVLHLDTEASEPLAGDKQKQVCDTGNNPLFFQVHSFARLPITSVRHMEQHAAILRVLKVEPLYTGRLQTCFTHAQAFFWVN